MMNCGLTRNGISFRVSPLTKTRTVHSAGLHATHAAPARVSSFMDHSRSYDQVQHLGLDKLCAVQYLLLYDAQ
jgi:hypothetical protein